MYVIDEIEKMGLFSKPFVKGIRAILCQGPHLRLRKLRGMEPLVVLATLPKVSGEAHQLINEIKSREDCALFEVSIIVGVIIQKMVHLMNYMFSHRSMKRTEIHL